MYGRINMIKVTDSKAFDEIISSSKMFCCMAKSKLGNAAAFITLNPYSTI